ncbi:helix-turn-helix domain-containing protein [Paraburkholderia humisilvae]|uniref:helix-turn-helix domain-containing protein n=2 Tax=Paraburkholderia humisilvae TaxID=627669 RepID=UPI00360E5FEC
MTTIVCEMQNSGCSLAARMTSYSRAFGKALRGFRKATKSTQDALASEAGLDRTYISLLELGQRSPTLDTMFALCQALNISLAEMAAAIEAALPPHLDE